MILVSISEPLILYVLTEMYGTILNIYLFSGIWFRKVLRSLIEAVAMKARMIPYPTNPIVKEKH